MKFNPMLQKRREENMSKAIATRMAKKETPAPTKVVQLAPKSANNLVKEKLEDIKKEIEEQPIIVKKAALQTQPKTQPQPQPQPQHQQDEEFDRVEVVKKKRNGVWLQLLG